MSSLRATWQKGLYKNKHTEQHKNSEHQDATYIKKTFFCVFRIFLFLFFIYDFLNDSPRNVYMVVCDVNLWTVE